MTKKYEITLNEITAMDIMLRTEMSGECPSLVNKLAEVTDTVPCPTLCNSWKPLITLSTMLLFSERDCLEGKFGKRMKMYQIT